MKGRGKEGGELGSCDRLHALLHRSAGVGVPNCLQHTGDTAPRKKPREWAMAFFFLPRQPLPSYLRNILAGGYWPPHWTRESPVVLPTAAFWGPGRTTYGYCCWLLKLLWALQRGLAWDLWGLLRDVSAMLGFGFSPGKLGTQEDLG
jgi:hypothetical protein